MPTPHRVVDEVLDGLADGAAGVIRSVQSGLKSAGETVMAGLDKPFRTVTSKTGPHRIVDRALDGAVDAAASVPTEGMIKLAQIAGEGICHALDQTVEELGVPPDLRGLGLFHKF